MDFNRRLSRLERQNYFLRASFVVSLFLLVVAVSMGAHTGPPEEITAAAISIVDTEGNVRMRLSAMDEQDSGLVTGFSAEGGILWTLGQRDDAGLITVRAIKPNLREPEGIPRVEVWVKRDEPLVTFKTDPYPFEDFGRISFDNDDRKKPGGLRWQHWVTPGTPWSTKGSWTLEDVNSRTGVRRR